MWCYYSYRSYENDRFPVSKQGNQQFDDETGADETSQLPPTIPQLLIELPGRKELFQVNPSQTPRAPPQLRRWDSGGKSVCVPLRLTASVLQTQEAPSIPRRPPVPSNQTSVLLQPRARTWFSSAKLLVRIPTGRRRRAQRQSPQLSSACK